MAENAGNHLASPKLGPVPSDIYGDHTERMPEMSTITAVSNVSLSQVYGSRAPLPQPKDGKDPMAAVAKALGMSSDDLRSALKSGKSVNDLAEANGLSHDDLIAAIKAGMPAEAKASDDDPTAAAEKIAATKGRPEPPGGPRGNLAGLNDTDKLNGLSSLTGTDSDTLGSMSSAQQLVNLMRQKGVELGSLRNVLNSGDLLDVNA